MTLLVIRIRNLFRLYEKLVFAGPSINSDCSKEGDTEDYQSSEASDTESHSQADSHSVTAGMWRSYGHQGIGKRHSTSCLEGQNEPGRQQ